MDRRVAIRHGNELPEWATGAAVFADISGFSALATRLVRASGPERAAEQLSAAVDAVFGVLIDALHGSGGAAVGFAGDAVTGWIGDVSGAAAAPRAIACAHAMQSGVSELTDQRWDDGEPLRVALRVGLAAGPARRLLLGDPAVQRFDVVAGSTVSNAVAAQRHARPGEVVAAREAVGDAAYARVDGPREALARRWWPDPGELALPAGVTERWHHAAVLEHLETGAPLLADLRRVAVLFARCPPIDFDADAAARDRLDRLVRSAQQLLGDAGGTLLHVVVGDKGSYLVGAVGAPVAQPDHSRRLARAALALQEAVPEGLAVGLAEGRAWAGLVGMPECSCYTLLGDVLNRAARLMEHAPAGETYVSPRLARGLAGAFELHEAGRTTLKGEAEPVALVALRAERAAAATVAGPPPMVGRRPELQRLRALLTEAAAGARRWASVRGAAGLGKSRLLHALTEIAHRDGIVVVPVTGRLGDRDTPYLAWRDAFLALVGNDPGPALATLPAPAEEHAPLLRPVLPGAPDETEVTLALSPDARQESTLRLLVELLAAARSDRPLLICADDAQWLDSASAALLRRAAGELDRVVVVVAARPEASREDEPRADLRLELAPLARDEVLALVARALGVDTVADPVARFVTARVGGHPLFAEQLAFALRDAGVLQLTGRRCRLAHGADLGAVELPESVEGLIANRLDGMPADTRAVAKVASVVGEDFTGALLGELAVPGLTTEVDAALERLAAGHLISGGPRYTFHHALIRDVVYGRLLHGQRKELHRLVALHHEDREPVAHAVLAEHWERAGVPERAVDHLELAGPAALQAGAFAECVVLLERALALAPATDARRRAEWQWHAANALYRLGRLDRSRAFAEAAVAEFDRPVPRSAPGLAAATGGQGIRQLAHRSAARRLLARAPAAERRRLRLAARGYLQLTELYYIASRKPQSAYAVLRALNLAETAGPTPELAEAYGALCIIGGVIGRHRMAKRYADLAFATAAVVPDANVAAIVRHQASMFHSCIGDFDRVFADEDVAIDMYRRMGDLGRTRDCLIVAGVAAHQAGRRDLAEHYLTTLLESRRGDEEFLGGVWAHAWLGAGALRAGALDAALAHLERAAERSGEPGHEAHAIVIDAQFALACRHAGRHAESEAAAERARAAIAVTRGRPVGPLVLDGYTALAQLAVLLCDERPDGARHLRRGGALDRACRDLAAFARVLPVGAPARWLYAGELASRRGRHTQARRAWRRSRSAAARLGMRHELQLAERRLGANGR